MCRSFDTDAITSKLGAEVFFYTREAFVYKIHKLRNSIHEELNGFSCKILWRNSLALAKLPHGTNASNGLNPG
jgi:hypothetical protein